MPNRLNNWKYNDVVKFLKVHRFQLTHTRGSHYYFYGIHDKKGRQVCVPYHSSSSIKPRTMKSIILQSGISQKDWFRR